MSRPATALRIVHSAEPISEIHVGDLVRTGNTRFPHYEVIAVSGGRAWVRDVQYDTDHVVRTSSVHRI